MTGPGEAEPSLGDFVTYVGAAYPRRRNVQFIAVGTNPAGLLLLVTVDGGGHADWFVAAPADLRVVRRASYTDVQS